MQVIEVTTDHANIRVVALERNENREWLHRHALHQLIKAYRKDYGAEATERLMTSWQRTMRQGRWAQHDGGGTGHLPRLRRRVGTRLRN